MHERRCISSIILCASSYVPDMHGNLAAGHSFRCRAGCRDLASQQPNINPCAMCDHFEFALLAHDWTWDHGMPVNSCFLPVSGANEKRLKAEAGFIYLRGQTGRYERFTTTVHDQHTGVWIFTTSTSEKVMVRKVGGNVLWCIHADHLPEEGVVRLDFDEHIYVSCIDKSLY